MQGYSHIPKKRKVQPTDRAAPLSADAANAEEVNKHASLYSPHIRPLSFPEGGGSSNQLGNLSAGGEGSAELTPPPRGLYTVLKFGGSSMGSAHRLAHVLDTICQQVYKSERGVSSFHPTPVPSAGRSLLKNVSSSSAQPETDSEETVLTGRVAVVVSAPGNTTDWLLDAAEYAAQGQLESALGMIDRVAETAITNAFAATAIPPSFELPSSDENGTERSGDTNGSGLSSKSAFSESAKNYLTKRSNSPRKFVYLIFCILSHNYTVFYPNLLCYPIGNYTLAQTRLSQYSLEQRTYYSTNNTKSSNISSPHFPFHPLCITHS